MPMVWKAPLEKRLGTLAEQGCNVQSWEFYENVASLRLKRGEECENVSDVAKRTLTLTNTLGSAKKHGNPGQQNVKIVPRIVQSEVLMLSGSVITAC